MDDEKVLKLLSHIPELFFLLSPEFGILWGNNALRELVGEKEKLICYELIHRRKNPPSNCPALKALETKKTCWAVMQAEALDKEFFVMVSPVIKDDKVQALWHLALENPKDNPFLAEDLRVYYETIGLLATGLSHDIKNMLTAALGELELLEMYAQNNLFLKRKCQKVRTILENITELAEKFCDIGKNNKKPELININQVFHDMKSLLKALVPAEIDFQILLNPYVGEVFINRGRLEQIILNLVLNAIQAISGTGKISLNSFNEGDYVVISVEDNGKGIKKELLQKIFEPYFSTKKKGSGLGLAMIKKWIKEAKGKIKISSVEGEGTRVEVWLPRAL
ncbi:histidine kinase [Thermodesulfatator indicus DSM 15286]|uniref:histidine kinase n=1 Tax=Thermodesulfatator indicus (strain DSM 15286 / JCM 11887 / CIR29812) TaxID=667014 RepID=F8A8W6_THEID|nr:ATP-binding protein [Thermodesulfatator indicus]AEH44013.1 histidine kinase [Thermodesulfatator indicus DSM 15286]